MNLSPKISWLPAAMMMLAPLAVTEGQTTPVDLGTLGGSFSVANAINKTQSAIAGNSSLSGDVNFHAFRKLTGALQDLGTLPLNSATPTGNSNAAGVSDNGVAVGNSDFDSVDQYGNVNRYQHAFYFTTTMTDVGTLGGNQAWANGIAHGIVVGQSTILGEAATHAFTYLITSNKIADLGTLAGGLNSYAMAINYAPAPVVAGSSDSGDGTTHAVTWGIFPTTITDLGNGGGPYAQANAINDLGVPAGYFYTLEGDSHAFVGINLTNLGTLGGSQAQANGINNSGMVVGSSNIKDDAAVHAFVWSSKMNSGKMVDMNDSLPAGSPWVLESANSIAKDGTIVGVGLINGVFHAFSWTWAQ